MVLNQRRGPVQPIYDHLAPTHPDMLQ